MELKEFQGLALRTESRIQGINLDKNNLTALLQVVVAITEILDGVKKATFYNKTTKLEGNYVEWLHTIKNLVDGLLVMTEDNGPVGAVMAQEATMTNIDPRVFHGIIGIITESGELASALLKSVEDGNHEMDAVNLQEEMSDIAWYEAILHDTLGLDWGQGLHNVINKLRIRYPEKYSDHAAENRNLDAERSALEVGITTPEPWPLKDISDVSGDNTRRVFYVEVPEGMDVEEVKDILARYSNQTLERDE